MAQKHFFTDADGDTLTFYPRGGYLGVEDNTDNVQAAVQLTPEAAAELAEQLTTWASAVDAVRWDIELAVPARAGR